MARTAKRYKKNTEKKIPGIPVCMAAIYARLSVDNDEKKSESIETQVTLIKNSFRSIMKIRTKSMRLLYMIFILIWEKPEQILTDRDLNG